MAEIRHLGAFAWISALALAGR